MANHSRSLYPESVEVHDRHLQNTELQRIESDKQILVDATTRGVVSGLAISVVSGSVFINVASGGAYAPNGEYMWFEAPFPLPNTSLADYTAGTKNYVLLVYDEQTSDPESREADGITAPTKAEVLPRLAILAETDYNVLPDTDTVLSHNALDRACILAIVTANGVGTSLTSASIQHPTAYGTVISATKAIPGNITGVSLGALDNNTPIGTGELTYIAYNKSITWKSPGESAGSPRTIATTGDYQLTSSSGCTLDIHVESSLLPLANATDTVTITSVYTQSIPRHTAEDFQHRAMLGSGVATAHNPHGLTYADIGGSTGGSVEEHQDMMHANGITRVSDANTLLATVNYGGAIDDLSVVGFAAGSTAYINGSLVQTPTANTIIPWTDVITTTQSLWGVWVSYIGSITKHLRAQFSSNTLDGKIQLLDVVGITGTITINSNPLSIGGPSVITPATDTIVRLYDISRVNYITVYVKGAAAAATDTITISAEPDPEENMPICNVPFSGLNLGVGSLGYGFGIQSAPNLVYDRRLWGNLDEIDTRTDAGIINSAEIVSNLLGNGIYVRSHVIPGTTDGEVSVLEAYTDQFKLTGTTVNGGVVYIDGHKLNVPTTTVVLPGNIYVDSAGIIQYSTDSWSTIIANQFGKSIVRLYESTVDIREFVGQKRNVPMGVVGLDVYGRASVAVNGSYIAITGSNSGSGYGGEFNSAAGTGLHGVGVGGTSAGVHGWCTSGYGVAGDGGTYGVFGSSANIGVYGATQEGTGVKGYADGTGTGVNGSSEGGIGVSGDGDTGTGGQFTGGIGVDGEGAITGYGVIGRYGTLITGTQVGTGVVGSSIWAYGIEGVSSGNAGIYGHSSVADGIRGKTTSTATCAGVSGEFLGTGVITGFGVYGANTNATDDSVGYGVAGYCTSGGTGNRVGVYGNGRTHGVKGETYSTNTGVSVSVYGIYGSATRISGGTDGCIGVYGTGTTIGIQGNSTATAVKGSGGTEGVYGHGSSSGITGESPDTGVYGSGDLIGVYALGETSGVQAFSGSNHVPTHTGVGVYAAGSFKGVEAFSEGTTDFAAAVYGQNIANAVGDVGPGVCGVSTRGPGGKFIGNIYRAPLNITYGGALPNPSAAGDICIILSSLSVPNLCFNTGGGTWWHIPFLTGIPS